MRNILKNNPDHLFIAAASNENEEITPCNPKMTCSAKAENQICVGATTKEDTIWIKNATYGSNWGKPYVHVMAPGKDIKGLALNHNFYDWADGTSYACPHVSGLAALLMTMRGNLSPLKVKQLIVENVQLKAQYADHVTSGGLIDVKKTIDALIAGTDFIHGHCHLLQLPKQCQLCH